MDSYVWGLTAKALALREILGLELSYYYDEETRETHIALLEKYGRSSDNVPSPPN